MRLKKMNTRFRPGSNSKLRNENLRPGPRTPPSDQPEPPLLCVSGSSAESHPLPDEEKCSRMKNLFTIRKPTDFLNSWHHSGTRFSGKCGFVGLFVNSQQVQVLLSAPNQQPPKSHETPENIEENADFRPFHQPLRICPILPLFASFCRFLWHPLAPTKKAQHCNGELWGSFLKCGRNEKETNMDTHGYTPEEEQHRSWCNDHDGEFTNADGVKTWWRLRASPPRPSGLVAAALELYAALKKIDDENGRHFHLDAECVSLLRAALAKAEGK